MGPTYLVLLVENGIFTGERSTVIYLGTNESDAHDAYAKVSRMHARIATARAYLTTVRSEAKLS